MLGGVDVPLLFASDGQIDAQILFDLIPNTRQTIGVRTTSENGAQTYAVPEIRSQLQFGNPFSSFKFLSTRRLPQIHWIGLHHSRESEQVGSRGHRHGCLTTLNRGSARNSMTTQRGSTGGSVTLG
jgi:hypothetical protein